MAFKLTPGELADRDQVLAHAVATQQDLEAQFAEFLELYENLCDNLNDKVTAYNEALENVAAWRETLVERLNEEVDERSDTWQDSDKAATVKDWISEIEDIALDALELDLGRAPDMPDFEVLDQIRSIPPQPGE